MPFWRSFQTKTIQYFVALVVIISLSSAVLHDFHTSLAEVEYNPASKSFEVGIRIFSDDLENALRAENANAKIVVDGRKETEPFIAAYLKKNFTIEDKRQKPGSFTMIGAESEGDVTWAYFEIKDIDVKSKLIIKNTVLTEVFDDQNNIVNIKINKDRKSFLFSRSNPKSTLDPQ